jgi:hypothetical protein
LVRRTHDMKGWYWYYSRLHQMFTSSVSWRMKGDAISVTREHFGSSLIDIPPPAKDKKGVHIIENTISFIGQSDSHFPRLSTEDTFEFAW